MKFEWVKIRVPPFCALADRRCFKPPLELPVHLTFHRGKLATMLTVSWGFGK